MLPVYLACLSVYVSMFVRLTVCLCVSVCVCMPVCLSATEEAIINRPAVATMPNSLPAIIFNCPVSIGVNYLLT